MDVSPLGRHSSGPTDCYEVIDERYYYHRIAGTAGGENRYSTGCGRVGMEIPDWLDRTQMIICRFCYPPAGDRAETPNMRVDPQRAAPPLGECAQLGVYTGRPLGATAAEAYREAPRKCVGPQIVAGG